MRICLAILLVVLISSPVVARSEEAAANDKEGPYAGLGAVFQNMLKISHTADARRSLYGEVYLPELVAGYRFWKIFPTVGWTILGRKTNDGEMRRSLFRLDIPYIIPHDNELQFKAGIGAVFYRLKGEGSTVSIRNGATYSNFYVPEGSQISGNLYVGGGASLLKGMFRYDFDLFVAGPLTTKRSINLALRAGHVF